MFYSHEVLTSRKYGVATVWLVATLGAKSNSKKINRKAILEVDVPNACRTIVDPAAPMALRLQGNLLYGVSRVYVQQCGYVLSDAENAFHSMHKVLQAVKDAALDPEAGKSKPEQLVLQDDPSFLPEFAVLPPDFLAEMSLEPLDSGDSQLLTPFSSQRDLSMPEAPIEGLVLPPSSSPDHGEFRIQGDHGPDSVGAPSRMFAAEGADERMPEPGFTFDVDGNVVEWTEANIISGTTAAPEGVMMPSDASASARVRREHEEGLRVGVQPFGDQMDLELPIFDDDLPEGNTLSGIPPQEREPTDISRSSVTVGASLQRKRRAPRILHPDTTMELRNKDLADWNTNYLNNMENLKQVKDKKKAAKQAKENADYYVWGSGIGGIASLLPKGAGPTPFDIFIGDNFFELFTGVSRQPAPRKKHDRDSGIDEATQAESRRVRQKTGEPESQVGRGEEDEAMFLPGGDEVELPRDAPTALDDYQAISAMPWNITASIRSSSVIPRSGRVGVTGSVGAPSSFTGLRARQASRMISASPLQGRGQPDRLEDFQGFEDDDNGLEDLDADDFRFGGPGVSSDMPQAALVQPTVRICEALSAEGQNFLGYVDNAITEKRVRARAELGEDTQPEAAADVDVSFEELLPPTENSRMVAAHALMMALSLGTKGLLDVRQNETFGEIALCLTEMGKAARVTDIAEEAIEGGVRTEESGEGGQVVECEKGVRGEKGEEEFSQFEEQFLAGQYGSEATECGDDDSLYAD